MPVFLHYRKGVRVPPFHIQHCLEALLVFLRMKSAIIELSLVGETAIRSLNRKFRRKDCVTDVLSFPLDVRPRLKKFPWHLGEIVVAVPVARRQACQAGRSLTQQVIRLAVHGLIHLRGMDHERGEGERRRFEKGERYCLKYLHRKGLNSWDGSLRL